MTASARPAGAVTYARRVMSVATTSEQPHRDEPATWSADEALTELYRVHWRSLVRLAHLLVRDQAVAEEVVQDAFVAMHRRWRRLADPDRALAYLRTSVVNGARTALRRQAVRDRWTASGGPTRTDPAPREDGRQPSAEAAVVAAEERRAVTEVLLALPVRQREVLVLRYHLDLSEREIAEALGISPGAVKSHAHRGLAALRAALQPTTPPAEEPAP